MTDHNDQPLRPADFSPHTPAPQTSSPGSRKPSPWFWPALVGGAALVIFVFLLLPSLVTPPSEEANTSVNTSTTQSSGQSPASPAKTNAEQESGSERSPFAEAQLQKQRRAAQEALQEALELQEVLSELSVSDWAPEEYAAAIALAEAGDTAYRDRDFIAAATAYQNAAAALVALEASIPERAEQAIAKATQAIEVSDTGTAIAQRELLQKMVPGDARAPSLQQRIDAIPAVTSAIETAKVAAGANDFSEAVTAIRQALEADPAHQSAQALFKEYQQLDADARFRKAMSDGYLALEESRFDVADKAFKQAAKIRPGAPEPQAAQVELAAARTAATLRTLQKQGTRQEQAEQWADAVETYKQAMAIDGTILFAQEGLARAEPRSALAKTLAGILENTERLVDPRALRDAEAQLAIAQSIPSPGPVLRQQIADVSKALEYASTPVNVELVSDGLTDITLLRVKRLGTFATTTLTLRPGSYTAMGVRNGFRDVRINFDVTPGTTPSIEVRCTEAI